MAYCYFEGGASISDFYGRFCEMKIVKERILDEFGPDADRIIASMREGQIEESQSASVDELIFELIIDESEWVESIAGIGWENEEFDVRICRFGDAYWYTAIEFPNFGLYSNLEEAAKSAQAEFSSFIEALQERQEKE